MKSICYLLFWLVIFVNKCLVHSAPYGIFGRQEDAVIVDANPSFDQPAHNPVYCRHRVHNSPSSYETRNYYQTSYQPYTTRVRNSYTSPQRIQSQQPSYYHQTYNNDVQETRSPPMATPYFPRKAVGPDVNVKDTTSYFQMTKDDVIPSSSYSFNRQNNIHQEENVVAPSTSYLPPVAPTKCAKCEEQNQDVVRTSSYSQPSADIVDVNRDVVVPPSSYSQLRTATSGVQENANDFGLVCHNKQFVYFRTETEAFSV